MKMQKGVQQGFTLIELMIVIAIVGILAAIALPAYQDYTVRAKMSEPLAVLAEAKTTIAEYYATQNSFPSADAAGINTNPDTDIVASVLYVSNSSGVLLEAFVKQDVIPGATGQESFVLSGYTGAGRKMYWTCLPSDSSRVSGATGTAMAAKYLPANCRG